jgi:hypothetical protein
LDHALTQLDNVVSDGFPLGGAKNLSVLSHISSFPLQERVFCLTSDKWHRPSKLFHRIWKKRFQSCAMRVSLRSTTPLSVKWNSLSQQAIFVIPYPIRYDAARYLGLGLSKDSNSCQLLKDGVGRI